MLTARKWESTVLISNEKDGRFFGTICLFAGGFFCFSMFTLAIQVIVLKLQQKAKQESGSR